MVNVVVKETNEVIGFPDTWSQEQIDQTIRGDLYGEISQPKPNFYKDTIQPALESSGMDMFQPVFVTADIPMDAYSTALRGFGTGITFGILDPAMLNVTESSSAIGLLIVKLL